MPQLPQLRIFNTTSIYFNAIRENKTLAKILNVQVIDLDSRYFDSSIMIVLTAIGNYSQLLFPQIVKIFGLHSC